MGQILCIAFIKLGITVFFPCIMQENVYAQDLGVHEYVREYVHAQDLGVCEYFPAHSIMCVYALAQPFVKVCVCECGCVQRKGTPAPLFQAIKLQQHRDEEGALIFFSFAVIASAFIFDREEKRRRVLQVDIPGINIYIYIHRGSTTLELFTDVSDLKPLQLH